VQIPFTRPRVTGREMPYLQQALSSGQVWGGGAFSKWCSSWLEERTGTSKALITQSATDALEMAALLLDLRPGDEVIMPSYTFVSTANAFALRGVQLVFVDIDEGTQNIRPEAIRSAITRKTRALVVVHYAGIACDMDAILKIAHEFELYVVEDAAQAISARHNDRALGSIGDLGCLSFHGTKNVSSGEGGALLINNPKLAVRAEILHEKGTNRSRFVEGLVDKYTWVDLGSSFLPSELTTAVLRAQLESAEEINKYRRSAWARYHSAFSKAGLDELCTLPRVPAYATGNGHMFQVMFDERLDRAGYIREMTNQGIQVVSHYVPLHSSPAGERYGRTSGILLNTDSAGSRLVRFPMWSAEGLEVEEVAERAISTLERLSLERG
jgi:dTDP-4-amino-4,6-dideoxygalactose transaminase